MFYIEIAHIFFYMNNNPTKTVSLQSSSISWEAVDGRANELGLDRSKYCQTLFDLDLKYHILSNHNLLHSIKNPRRYNMRVVDVVFLLFLLAILTLIISVTWVI
jgi:hypothetical protein